MDREFSEKTSKKVNLKSNDKPQCERCGRPVKISSEDYMSEEVLCINCASEMKVLDCDDYEMSRGLPD